MYKRQRLLQGLSLGGEYASATTFLAEMAPPNKRGFYSSFVFFSAAVGILAASAVGWLLTSTLTKAEICLLYTSRPSKLRLVVDAQRSPGRSTSSFMARHIEQPGWRHSKPRCV